MGLHPSRWWDHCIPGIREYKKENQKKIGVNISGFSHYSKNFTSKVNNIMNRNLKFGPAAITSKGMSMHKK